LRNDERRKKSQRRPAGWWLRFPNEIAACPACTSQRIQVLDAFFIPRTSDGRRISFATGCDECGLLFSNPVPTREDLDRFYSTEGPWAALHEERTKRIEEKALLRRKEPKPRRAGGKRSGRDLLLEALTPYLPIETPLSGAKVLDVGCGDGRLLDRLQDLGWQTYGIEPSTSVAFLRHHRLDAPPPDHSFDFAILHHVLEHVAEPLGLLRQVAGALRDGGVLFLSVPRLDTLPVHRQYRYCLNGRRHIVAFSERCLQGLLARAGLAFTARVDAGLDETLTEGQPKRLRVVATRTTAPLHLPASPLAPARKALRDYGRTGDMASRMRRLLPVRVRAALLDRARE